MGLLSLAKSLVEGLAEKRAPVILEELSEVDDSNFSIFSFQYFPETLSDSKTVNYNSVEIPGGSLPIYQWQNSGERTISFTAVFTSDIDPTLDAAAMEELRSMGELRRNVDIRTAVLWLRRFMLPIYGAASATGVPLVYAPRKAYLTIPNSGIGLWGGSPLADSVLVKMDTCDVEVAASFPSGAPRVATVTLGFSQLAQHGGTIWFPSVTEEIDNLVILGDKQQGIFPYSVVP